MARGYAGKKYIGKYANGDRIADEMQKREKEFRASLSKEQRNLQKAMLTALEAYNIAVSDRADRDAVIARGNDYRAARAAFETSLCARSERSAEWRASVKDGAR